MKYKVGQKIFLKAERRFVTITGAQKRGMFTRYNGTYSDGSLVNLHTVDDILYSIRDDGPVRLSSACKQSSVWLSIIAVIVWAAVLFV